VLVLVLAGAMLAALLAGRGGRWSPAGPGWCASMAGGRTAAPPAVALSGQPVLASLDIAVPPSIFLAWGVWAAS
jgi:hypothetical protein